MHVIISLDTVCLKCSIRVCINPLIKVINYLTIHLFTYLPKIINSWFLVNKTIHSSIHSFIYSSTHLPIINIYIYINKHPSTHPFIYIKHISMGIRAVGEVF